MIRFTLDGRDAVARDGDSLLDALHRNGVSVPTLCDDDELDPYGGCRLCLVEVEGAARPLPACATNVEDGMVVSTNGAAHELRSTLLEMLLSEHSGGAGAGRRDELLDLADAHDVERPFVLPDAHRTPYDDRNQLLAVNTDACILCERCVRYAREVQQCSALTLVGRGADARVVPTHSLSWLDTECELCGGCLSVCPTGALYEKRVDGAAKPESELRHVRTTCAYCGVGCQLDLVVDDDTRRIVKVTSRREYLPNRGDLCVKGRFAYTFVHSPERLTTPLVRGDDGELHEATWDEALARAAKGLQEVKDRHGPQSIGVLSSARLTMEENYLIQKLARTALGTNSVHSCEGT